MGESASWGASAGFGVLGAGCGIRVGWRTVGVVWFLFFEGYLLALAEFSIWQGGWAGTCIFHVYK